MGVRPVVRFVAHPTATTFVAVAAVALVAASCSTATSAGRTTTTSRSPSTSTTLATSGSISSAASTSTTAPGSGEVVTAIEKEYTITLSTTTFTPGTYTFVADNKGTIVHSLQITGSGLNKRVGDLSPGQSADLTVQLRSGMYDVFCPIPGHKQLGMNVEITVS